jgi:hypothetical protein
MTQTQFFIECAKRTIEPSIALENENLREALKNRNDETVIHILNEEF